MKMGGGRIVVGDDFWDRKNEQAYLVRMIEEGRHVNLFGQRRMGKTSLMKHIAEQLQGKYRCIFVDLQQCRCGADAVTELSVQSHKYKDMWSKTQEVFANILGKVESAKIGNLGITLRAGLDEGNWSGKGSQLFRIFADSDKPVVLFLDELPIMVSHLLRGGDLTICSEGKKRADEFMSWLRKNSIEHQGKVRIVISGSIGIVPILRQAKLTATINNYTPMELTAWDIRTAEECIMTLAKQYKMEFEDGSVEAMTKKLGCCVPHHVQVFFDQIHERCARRRDNRFTQRDVAEVYRTEMLGARAHVELMHYEERIETVLGKPLSALAFDMLTEAAVSGCLTAEAIKAFQKKYSSDGRSTIDAQKEILGVLEHDGYLKQTAKGYRFVSKYLRDWWKNRHRLGYVKILEWRA